MSGEVPDHRPDLELVVEAQGVVDGPQLPVVASQYVAALTVGVVGHQIPGCEAHEGVGMGRVIAHGEVVLFVVARHVQLD